MSRQSLLESLALACFCIAARAQTVPDTLEAYALPAKAQQALGELAAETDVLILGEIHGTQEVPRLSAALLAPLSKLGYGTLALEIPGDQRQPLTDWATGKSTTIPRFFTKRTEDGRGNVQVLSLIRTALAPPHCWQLICFDQDWPIDYDIDPTPEVAERPAISSKPDDVIAISIRRDREMATKLIQERSRLAPDAKVLAICGGMHARTSKDCRPDSSHRFPQESPASKLWPSFAGQLQIDQPTWRIRSVNVVPHSGAYFAMMSVGGAPPTAGIHTIRQRRRFDEAEAHPLKDEYWDWELNLPKATPATFRVTPTTTVARVDKPELRQELLQRAAEEQAVRKELIEKGIERPDEAVQARMKQIDAENHQSLKDIVQEHGWPGAKLVGEDGSEAAFLIVQHAELEFQKEMFPLVEQAYKNKDLSGQSYALLVDRIRVREGKPQIYGTQAKPFEKWIDREPALMPIEDEANVEKRRAEVGLPPLPTYLKMLKQTYFPQHKDAP